MKNIILRVAALGAMTLIACGMEAKKIETYQDIADLQSLQQGVASMRPMADSEHFTVVEKGSIVERSYRDADSERVLFSAPADDYRINSYQLSADQSQLLIDRGETSPIYRHSYTTHYDLYRNGELVELFAEQLNVRDATLSPDGEWVMFSSENNLYLYNIASQQTRQLTDDGEWNNIINGTTDWVYEEELGFTRAYWFSPDSKHVAYLKFDESQVPLFEMMRYDSTLYNRAYSFKYPKAGDRNSTVSLWVYDVENDQHTKIDTSAETDQYIPTVGYTPKGELYYFRLNRKQNDLQVMLCEEDGSQRVIYEESSPKYIERVGEHILTFIDDEHFVVREETTAGYFHLYLYSTKKGLRNAITKGDWEVVQMLGVDKKDRLYYVSTEGSELQRAIYSVKLNGRDKQKLSGEAGYYTASTTPSMKYYVATYQNVTTPAVAAIYDNRGKLVRQLYDNAPLRKAVAESNLAPKEFFTFTTPEGYELNGYMQKPLGFDPAKKYPVLLTQYSGPGSQSVADRFGFDWTDVMPSYGYIVVCVDGRGTGFRGETFKKLTYEQLGRLEVEDQLSLVDYMAAQSYVDAERIGIYGWSYGGFMALNVALHGGDKLKMAIAVAPVTSWRYYDSIYTEVYNGLPQDNGAGYDDPSPLSHAEKLSPDTKLLMIHGTADDNVHFQNSMEMARKLNEYGKKYDMMVYPDQNHSMLPDCKINVRDKMVEYTLQNL